MTADDPAWPFGKQSMGEICFSPNFSVYVLPPDGVCLYSEDRKIFLRGEVYCAVASRLGAGAHPEDIIDALSGEFPADRIDEAINRLLERRFAVAADLVGDTVAAGYWASIGLSAETVAQNLANAAVRIESMGAPGQSEIDAALRKFGVRVVDREANLTVVLVDDYFDSQLAEFNRQRLTEKQEWLLVQPSGIFPLVGPIFSRGKSACWTCLADRMKWNRQIKAFIDRKNARRVATSPLSRNLLGPGAIGLAATEIAKAIASGFRTELHHHVVSLDLLGSSVVRHHISARPQCPSCGSREMRSPNRPPLPLRLRVGGKAVMTSGGYRSVAPTETIARFRKLVSPLTGIVSQLERVKSEQPLDFTFVARHSFSPRPEAVTALQAQVVSDSFGTGSTADQAEASALMKAIERHCGIFQGDEIRTSRKFADFGAGDPIAPDDILLSGNTLPFDPSAEMEWSPVWSLRDERFKHVPTGLSYFFHDASVPFNADSSGCAAGNTLDEAILQGFFELVERDACAIWWYNRLQRPEIDLDRLGDSYIRDLRAQFAATGRGLWALDVTSDIDVPAVVAVSHGNNEEGQEHIAFAAGAHFDPRIAALRAVTKLNQMLAVDRMKRLATAPAVADGGDALPLPLRKHAYLLPHGKAKALGARSRKLAGLDRREQIRACVALAKRLGLDVLVLDQTRPDVGVPVVRVIVPGLRPFHRRLAPGRLYDVPVKLGLRKRPLREAGLNPLDPT